MFGNQFARSLAVAKESYAVLKNNPALGLFPLISGVALCIASAPFVVAILFASQGGAHAGTMHRQFGALNYALTAALYFVDMFVVVFFNAALVACANESLQGRPTTLQFGLRQALARLPQIITWAAIASTVGMILRTIGERSGIVGSIVTSLIGVVWNLAVFFVVPVLVIENVGPITAIKSSGSLLKQTWGERVILGIGISSVIALLGLLVVVPIGLSIWMFSLSLIPVGIFFAISALMYILVLAIVGSAMGTIYQTAIYLYCRTGMIAQGFQATSLQNAFKAKPESKFFGRG